MCFNNWLKHQLNKQYYYTHVAVNSGWYECWLYVCAQWRLNVKKLCKSKQIQLTYKDDRPESNELADD